MYAAGSEKEKRAPGPLHGGTIAHPFVFCKGGGAEAGRGALLWPAPSFGGGSGLACAVVPPAHPPTFLGTGGLPCTPGGGCAPCTPLGGRRRQCFLTWRVGMLPSQGKRDRDPLPNLPPSTRAGTEAPPGGLGEGDGTVAKRDLARSQRGHSPVKRGHSPDSR